MKKALYTSTALAAAGVLAFSATDSQAAAKKMSLSISGGFKSMIAWATQDDSYESTANSTARVHYDAFNLVNDSEIHFKGSSKLDNGIRVDVIVQLETDQALEQERNNGSRSIDESYMKLTGAFGDIRIGTTKTANTVLWANAPFAGAIAHFTPDADWFVIRPGAIAMTMWAPGVSDGGNDDMRIVYYTPKFNGFQIGAAYTPTSADDRVQPVVGGTSGTASQKYDVTASYSNKLGSVDLKLAAGYVINQSTAAASDKNWNVSGRVGVGGFSVGAGYKDRDDTDTTSAGAVQNSRAMTVWDAGVTYASGPFKVGVTYLGANTPQTAAVPGDDSHSKLMVGGNYTMGPGVTLLGTIMRVDWEDESTNDANNNDGWAVIGGISVAF